MENSTYRLVSTVVLLSAIDRITIVDIVARPVKGEFSLEKLVPRFFRQTLKARVSSIPSSLRNIGDMTQYMKKLRADPRERRSFEIVPKMRIESGSPGH